MPLILIALSATLAYTVVRWGGVAHRDQNFYLLALAIVAIATALWPSKHRAPRLSRVYLYLLPLLPAYAAFQIVPLPASWVVALSPARAQALDALASIGITSPYATLSVFPTGTRDYVLLLCGYIAVFFIVGRLIAAFPQHPWMVVLPLFLIAGWEALLGIVQYALSPIGTVVNGNYANRNHFAGLLELILPFAAAGPLVYIRKHNAGEGISTAEALKTAGMWTLAAAYLVAIIFSQSRMGFLSALLSLLIVGILAVATKAHVLPGRGAVALLMAGVVTVLALTFVFLPTDELIRRFGSAVYETNEKGVPDDVRAQDWLETIPMIRAYPLFGCGLGGYSLAFPKFKTVTPMSVANFAHNDYLQITAETGFIGATMFLILALTTLYIVVRRAFLATRPGTWALTLGCTGALGAILLHSTTDFNLYVPANAMVVSCITAMAVHETVKR